MPKKKAAESSSDTSINSSDDESKKPAKKQKTEPEKDKKKSKSSDDDSIESWDLARNRSVKVREFRGRLFVDIREYYEKDGKTLPGKKGISLSVEQWKKLSSLVSEIDKTVNDNS